MKIIMLGVPGAGKDTRAKKIAAEYQIPHISTGDIFRASIKNGTELGMEAKVFMDVGGLASDEITIGMLPDRAHEADCQNGYAPDGFPRIIPQAESLIKAPGEIGESIDYAANVDVPDENTVKRMSEHHICLVCGATHHIRFNLPKKEGICDVCGQVLVLRGDNKPETVKECLDVYHDQTQPPIECYQKVGVLAQMDDTMDMEDVFQVIAKTLGV